MFISSIAVSGFRDLAAFEARGLARAVTVRGPDPAATALGDALDLAFAALDRDALARLLARWDLLGPEEVPEIVAEPFPEQATWTDRHAAQALVDPDGDRTLTVEVGLSLDPPLYGDLRAQAARLPRLVTALSQGAELKLVVSGLFATSLDALAVSIQSVSVGEERFASAGTERAPWVDRLLRRLAHRFHRHDPGGDPAVMAMAAATSRERHAAYERWRAAQGGTVRVARGPGDRPVLLIDDKPARRWGAAGVERAAIAASVHLSGADVLWVESADASLSDGVTGDNSPLEQIWRVCAEGALQPEGQPPKPAPLGMKRP